MKRSIWGICLTGLMAVIIGAVGIFGIMTVTETYYWSSESDTEALRSIAKVLEYTHKLKNALYTASDATDLSRYGEEAEQVLRGFEAYMGDFEVHIVTSEVYMAFDEMRNVYFNEYLPRLFEMQEYMKRDESRDLLPHFLEPIADATMKMTNSADYCLHLVSAQAAEDRDGNDQMARFFAVVIAVLIALAVVLTVVFLIAVARYKRALHPAPNMSYPNPSTPPVYAMYPVDPSNPTNPPHSTHILYPVMHTPQPPQADDSRP